MTISKDQLIINLQKTLSIEKIKDIFKGDYKLIATAFFLEVDDFTDPLDIMKFWKRWSPLLRDNEFIKTLDDLTKELGKYSKNTNKYKLFKIIRDSAKELHNLSENELIQFFKERDSIEKIDRIQAERIALDYYEKAKLSTSEGDQNNAIINYNRAILAFKQLNNNEMLARTIMDLAIVYSRLKKYDESIMLTNKSLNMFENLNDNINQLIAKNNLAHYYFEKGELTSSELYADSCFEFLKSNIDIDSGIALRILNLQINLIKYKTLDIDKRVSNYLELAESIKKLHSKTDVSELFIQIAYELASLSQAAKAYIVLKDGLSFMLKSNCSPQRIQNIVNALPILGTMAGL